MLLPDWMIEKNIPINPLAGQQSRKGIISYGTTSYGYDVRVGYKFKVFTPVHSAVVDPKAFSERCFVDVDVSPRSHTFEENRNGQEGDGYCIRCRRRLVRDQAEEECPIGKADHILIPPNSFALAETIEAFKIPRDVLAICLGKSTYARCGVIVNVTPLEPEWEGVITIEISNTTPLPAKIYAGEGIAQIIFLQAESVCRTSYADKKGKYQGQRGLVLPKVD